MPETSTTASEILLFHNPVAGDMVVQWIDLSLRRLSAGAGTCTLGEVGFLNVHWHCACERERLFPSLCLPCDALATFPGGG